jgi:hypothetical protein
MPFKDFKRRYDRELIARKRAAERERLAAEGMAGWRAMATHPVANEWMRRAGEGVGRVRAEPAEP